MFYFLGFLIHIIFALPPEQQPQFSDPKWAGLELFSHDYLGKKRTIILSDATDSAKNVLMGLLGVPEKGAPWPNKQAFLETVGEVDGFTWLDEPEDSDKNRAAYINHLTGLLSLPKNYSLKDVKPNKTLLTVEIPELENQKISGTTDVVIAKSSDIENDAIRHSIEVLLELKKPENVQKRDHTPQTVGEHVAASYLNRTRAVVAVLTDLNNSWTFFWFARLQEGPGVALYKLKISGKKATGVAKYMLDSLYNGTSSENLPTSFVDRLSFEAVINTFVNVATKRARRDFGGGGGCGGAGGADSNLPDQADAKPKGGDKQHPTFSPSGNSSIDGNASQTNHRAGDSNCTMDMATALSLFAPSSNRDVANELELLDMVDKAEQYEIVRSFAMRHIVPYMTGQY